MSLFHFPNAFTSSAASAAPSLPTHVLFIFDVGFAGSHAALVRLPLCIIHLLTVFVSFLFNICLRITLVTFAFQREIKRYFKLLAVITTNPFQALVIASLSHY